MSPAKHKTGELFTIHVSIVISRRKAIQVAEEEYNDIHMLIYILCLELNYSIVSMKSSKKKKGVCVKCEP